MEAATPAIARPYHHGNLRAALVLAGYDLAAQWGTDAVTLRAVTRAAGVTPSAAYRHFDSVDDLRLAVGARAGRGLAQCIERHQAAVDEADPVRRAQALLEAVGVGYMAFALDQPGAFEVAMFGLVTMEHADDPEGAGDTGRTAFQLLTDALAGLVATGQLSADRVDAAAIQCWSSVHGFASLATRGPLRDRPRPVLDALARQLCADVVGAVLASGRVSGGG